MNRFNIFQHNKLVEAYLSLEIDNSELTKRADSALSKLKDIQTRNTALVSENNDLKNRNKLLEEAFLKYSPLFNLDYLCTDNQLEHFRSIWNKWSDIDDSFPDIRQERACAYRMTPLSIDVQHGCADFMGIDKEKYHTTLQKCECQDFIRHLRPCKHMYRLAHELDVETLNRDVFYVDDPSKLVSLGTFKTAILPLLTPSEIDLLSELRSSYCCIAAPSSFKTLMQKNLIEICSDKYFLLNSYNRDELLALLSPDDKFKRSSKKDELIRHIIKNYPHSIADIEKLRIAVCVSPYAEHLRDYF